MHTRRSDSASVTWILAVSAAFQPAVNSLPGLFLFIFSLFFLIISLCSCSGDSLDPSLSSLLPSFCAVFLKGVGILTHLQLSTVSMEAAVTFFNLPFFF